MVVELITTYARRRKANRSPGRLRSSRIQKSGTFRPGIGCIVTATRFNGMKKNLRLFALQQSTTSSATSNTALGKLPMSTLKAENLATIRGHLEMVRFLLDHGADINTQDGGFGTAMAAAITMRDHHMIKLLQHCGVDTEIQAPGSPIIDDPGVRAWKNHRSPFSRSRIVTSPV